MSAVATFTAAFAAAMSAFATAVAAFTAAVSVCSGGIVRMVQTVGVVMIQGIQVMMPSRIVRVMQGVAVVVPGRIVRVVQGVAIVAQGVVVVQRIAAAGDGHTARQLVDHRGRCFFLAGVHHYDGHGEGKQSKLFHLNRCVRRMFCEAELPGFTTTRDFRHVGCAVFKKNWYSVSVLTKHYLDYWSAWLRVPGANFRARMADKRLWALCALSDEDADRMTAPLAGTLRFSAEYLKMDWGGVLTGYGSRPGDVLEDVIGMEDADRFFGE